MASSADKTPPAGTPTKPEMLAAIERWYDETSSEGLLQFKTDIHEPPYDDPDILSAIREFFAR